MTTPLTPTTPGTVKLPEPTHTLGVRTPDGMDVLAVTYKSGVMLAYGDARAAQAVADKRARVVAWMRDQARRSGLSLQGPAAVFAVAGLIERGDHA